LVKAEGFPPGESAQAAYLGRMRDRLLDLATRVDAAVRHVRPDNWRGVKPKENVIKAALLPLLQGDAEAVERLFSVIFAQKDY